VIAWPDTVISNPLLQKFSFVAVDDCALLGAPLLLGVALDGAWANRCAELSRAKEKLSEISSQDALALLRASFSTPRVLHLLRCSPSIDHDALHTFDNTLRSAFSHITNSEVSGSQWLQASLPVKEGDLE